MLLTRAKRLLTDKELEDYLKLDKDNKRKQFLEKLKKELFEEYEFNRTRS